ncbi:hypothetical protein PanWU01x14_281040, partial [Parasponia andersonii]
GFEYPITSVSFDDCRGFEYPITSVSFDDCNSLRGDIAMASFRIVILCNIHNDVPVK